MDYIADIVQILSHFSFNVFLWVH